MEYLKLIDEDDNRLEVDETYGYGYKVFILWIECWPHTDGSDCAGVRLTVDQAKQLRDWLIKFIGSS